MPFTCSHQSALPSWHARNFSQDVVTEELADDCANKQRGSTSVNKVSIRRHAFCLAFGDGPGKFPKQNDGRLAFLEGQVRQNPPQCQWALS